MIAGRLRAATLAALWRYPVKGMRPEPLARVRVGERGLEGDRGSALFVASDGHARTTKTYRGKEDNLLHTFAGEGAARAAAAAAGIALELRAGGPHFDAEPVSVLFDAWLRELEALVDIALEPLRFRPNLYVESAGAVSAEAAFVGRALEIGGVRLRVVSPILRCVTTTYDVVTGEPEPAVLRALAQQRANVMGVYCRVERPGEIAVGDAVVEA